MILGSIGPRDLRIHIGETGREPDFVGQRAEQRCYANQADVHSVSMNVIPLILMAGLGVLGLYLLRASEQYRAGAIRRLAFRSGLHAQRGRMNSGHLASRFQLLVG